MLGFLDMFMSSIDRVSEDEVNNANKFSKYYLNRKSDLTWFCFLPRRTTLDIAKKYDLLPKNGNIVAYEVPLNLISSDPNETRNVFFLMMKDFEKSYGNKLGKKRIAFLGISVGSMPALFLANRYKTEKVRIVCSTAKLGEGIFNAFAARQIKQGAIRIGFNATKYDEILDEINPIENISNLPDDIKIVISRFDNYIPYEGAVKLAGKIKEAKEGAKIYKFSLVGHFLTMFRVGRLNKKYNFLN